jgi:hypothetical protein
MIYPEYKAVKITLIIICIAIISVGKTKQFWPITSWPLYSRHRPPFPSSSATLFQVIVLDKNNQVYELLLKDILSDEQLDKLTMPLVERIVERNEQNSSQIYQESFVSLIQKTLPNVDIKEIQIWKLHWTVNPLSFPMLDYERPNQKTLKNTMIID